MGHATADDLMKDLDHITEGLPKAWNTSNVHGWSICKVETVQNVRREYVFLETGADLINIGSCGLHIIHGAYKKGLESTG